MNVTGVPEQFVKPGLAETVTVAVTVGFTTNVSCVAVTMFVVTHPALEVNWQSIRSPFTGLAFVYKLPPPTTLRFFFQTKLGLTPPFTGVAVKITAVPAQFVKPGLAATETAGVTFAFTVTLRVPTTPLKQLFVGVTCTLPEVPPKFTVIFVVP